jgi:hypothetical protein
MNHEDIKQAPGELASLAGELTLLVDRVQADWDQCGRVSVETAHQLHQLRELAERMLEG